MGYPRQLKNRSLAKYENLWGMTKMGFVAAGYFLAMPFVLAWNLFEIFVMPWRD